MQKIWNCDKGVITDIEKSFKESELNDLTVGKQKVQVLL